MRLLPMILAAVLQIGIGEGRLAYGMTGDLKEPSLALPSEVPSKVRTHLIDILKGEAAKFLGGKFINAYTRLDYGGSVDALNRMLSGLAECERFRVQVKFIRETGRQAWEVEHNGWGAPFLIQVIINLGAETINPEDIDIPTFGYSSGSIASPDTPGE
jgi:hypothetical protein